MLDTAEADLLLGVDPGTPRADHEVVVERGATLLLYTDGLVETRDRSLEEGIDRLRSKLEELADEPLDRLCDGLLETLVPEPQEDDVALVAVRSHPEDPPRRGG